MDKIIVHPSEDNYGSFITIITPAKDCGLTVAEIAEKDVPYNLPYKILNASDLPSDRTFRDAWNFDFSNPDGFGLGSQRWFIRQATKDIEKGIDVEKNKQMIRVLKREVFKFEGVRL